MGSIVLEFSLLRGRAKPAPVDVRLLIERHSVPVAEVGCWLWLGAVDRRGYGTRRIGRRGASKNWFAHRLSYAAYKGPLLPGLEVLHTCDTPGCVNPAHLKQGTHRDNMRDMKERGRHWAHRRRRAEAN